MEIIDISTLLVSWFVTFPLDVVKTRMQGSQVILATSSPAPSAAVDILPSALSTTPLLGEECLVSRDVNPYRTIVSTIVYSYRTEGIGVFFRGLSPALIR